VGQQDSNYMAGQGAAWCATPNFTMMFDAPSNPGDFVTYVVYNGQALAKVDWTKNPDGSISYTISNVVPGQDTGPNVIVCGAKNRFQYKSIGLSPVCQQTSGRPPRIETGNYR